MKMFSHQLSFVLLAVMGLMSVHGADLAVNDDGCPIVCPLLMRPVCGTHDGQYQQFDNECLLAGFNCQTERTAENKLTLTDLAWCTSELVTDLHTTLGADVDSVDCLKPCPMIYAPVCITNGEVRATIPNACSLNLYNCVIRKKNGTAFPKEFRILRNSSC